MATAYSGWSKYWTPSGAKSKRFRARIDYTVTETVDSVTITTQLYVNINSSVSADFQGYKTVSSTRYPSSGTFSCSTVYKSSGGKLTVPCGGSHSITIAKKSTSQQVSITGQIRCTKDHGSSDWHTYQGVGVVFNIPAFGECSVMFDTFGKCPSPESLTVTYGDLIPEPVLPDVIGWKLESWCTDQACTQPFDFTTPITESMTLYAKWKKVPVFCKVDGEWHQGQLFVKTNDEWIGLNDIYVKSDDTWLKI